MAPAAKAHPPGDDMRPEPSHSRPSGGSNAKKARNGAAANAAASNSSHRTKDLAAAAAAAASASNAVNGAGSTAAGTLATATQAGAGMSWSSAPIPLLDAYRTAYNLPMATAFTTPRRQALLTNPGIGRQSPTMAQRKDKRRVSKDQLALAVRKHFNSAAVSEIDVVVEVIYRVKNQKKAFRMRSAPPSGPKKA